MGCSPCKASKAEILTAICLKINFFRIDQKDHCTQRVGKICTGALQTMIVVSHLIRSPTWATSFVLLDQGRMSEFATPAWPTLLT